MDNPFGVNGVFTRAGEHIPLVNNVMQEVHRATGHQEALQRARDKDPIGAKGVVTRIAEHVPLVNQGIQEMHRKAGRQEELERAKRKNPLGADGYVTKLGEHIPVINDGIMALHAASGQHDRAERTRARTLQGMLSKDGVITKVAELLPGSNLVAAAIHEYRGDSAEADRALDLVKNWRKAGAADGALTKLAELLPAVDVVAFGVHMNSRNYAQALRSITKTSYVNIQISSTSLTFRTRSLNELGVSDFFVKTVELSPKAPSVMGGLYDIMRDSLKLKSGGKGAMKEDMLEHMKKLMNAKMQTLVKDGLKKLPEQVLKQLSKSAEKLRDFRDATVPRVVGASLAGAAGSLDSLATACGGAGGEKSPGDRLRDWLVSELQLCLPTEMPSPQDHGFCLALHEAIRRSGATRGQVPALRALRLRPGAESQRLPEFAAGLSCLSCLGFLACGTPTGLLGCLAGLVAGLGQSERVARKRAVSMVNRYNNDNWESSVVPGSCRSDAVILELHREDMPRLRQLVYKYIWDEMLAGQGACKLAARLACFCASRWADDLEEPSDGRVPFVMELEVPQLVACDRQAGSIVDLTLPAFSALLFVDLRLKGVTGGPRVEDMRVVVKEEAMHCILESVRCQLEAQDLRSLHPGFSGFTRPINADFDLSLDWKRPREPQLVIRSVKTTLHLPQ